MTTPITAEVWRELEQLVRLYNADKSSENANKLDAFGEKYSASLEQFFQEFISEDALRIMGFTEKITSDRYTCFERNGLAVYLALVWAVYKILPNNTIEPINESTKIVGTNGQVAAHFNLTTNDRPWYAYFE